MAKKKTAKSAADTNALIKKEGASLPIPAAELAELSGQGFEDADKDAFAIPFLRILQKGSPQVDEDDPAFIEGAKPGMFFNTVTGELYDKSVEIIPVHYGRSFIEWQPNRGGFVKDHGNNPGILDRVAKIDEKNNSILDNGNVIQDTRNHFVLLSDRLEMGPIILSLTSTGIKHSRKWMTLMNALLIPGTQKVAPMFAGVWTVQTIRNENDEGTWYQIGDKSTSAVEFSGWVNADQLSAAQAARDLIRSGEAKADWDSTVDKPEETPAREPGDEDIDEDDPF